MNLLPGPGSQLGILAIKLIIGSYIQLSIVWIIRTDVKSFNLVYETHLPAWQLSHYNQLIMSLHFILV